MVDTRIPQFIPAMSLILMAMFSSTTMTVEYIGVRKNQCRVSGMSLVFLSLVIPNVRSNYRWIARD